MTTLQSIQNHKKELVLRVNATICVSICLYIVFKIHWFLLIIHGLWAKIETTPNHNNHSNVLEICINVRSRRCWFCDASFRFSLYLLSYLWNLNVFVKIVSFSLGFHCTTLNYKHSRWGLGAKYKKEWSRIVFPADIFQFFFFPDSISIRGVVRTRVQSS